MKIPINLPHTTLEAATWYRDNLEWAVHPLCGPKNKRASEKERGKKPILKGWKDWTPEKATDEFLVRHFGTEGKCNIGIVLQGNHVVVDLDSKADQGASVRAWMTGYPQLATVPRERTGGGAHLHFTCSDLPPITKDGKPYGTPLFSQLTANVTAELFSKGLNLVVAPSVHASGHTYFWEETGEIPTVSFAQLKEWFGVKLPDEEKSETQKQGPGRPKEEPPFWASYKGELRTLDFIRLFEEARMYGELMDADENKHTVQCPWQAEHSGSKDRRGTSTVIYTPEDSWPAFKCLHAHCANRELKDVLAYFEDKQPGIVDRYCKRKRVWEEGQLSEDGRPRIVLPGESRPDSLFATEAGELLAPKCHWFTKGNFVVDVRVKRFSEALEYRAFHEIRPVEACTGIETHLETGVLRQNKKAKDTQFVPYTMPEATANKLIHAVQFKVALPPIHRILDVQLPILYQGEIVFPHKSYDNRFHSFCDPNAPDVQPLSLEESLDWISHTLLGFCWTAKQDLIHALARLITPFLRGIMGFDSRFPLWVFEANRPRAGKDYLAGIAMILYQGHVCEDAPLGKEPEETRKRISTSLMTGRRMMHFANCRGHLENKDLEQAVTSKVWADRVLGGNTEIKLPNELEFSLSANAGLTYTPDLEPRIRKIRLGYPQEDPNSRTFPNPELHGWVAKNRAKILSAIAGLVTHWQAQGCPPGPTAFTSFPEWAKIVGGIMVAANLGDPCLPHEEESNIGGDRLTTAMQELFSICFERFPESWIEKKDVYELLSENQDNESLGYFGDLSEGSKDARASKTKFGIEFKQFSGRVLGGIRLERQQSGAKGRSDRARFRFVKLAEPATDNGQMVWGGVFSKSTAPGGTVTNGDLGDLGDLSNSVGLEEKEIGVTNREVELCVPEAKRWGEGLQGLQGLHQPGAVPTVLTSPDDLKHVAEAISGSAGVVALDIETYGRDALDPWRGDIRLLSLGIIGHEPLLLDLKAIGYKLGPLSHALQSAVIIGHNLKFDLLWLREKCGLRASKAFCTMAAARLLTAGTELPNGLGECLRRYLKVDVTKDQAKSDWGRDILKQDQIKYAATDVGHLHNLKAALEQELERAGLTRVARLEMDLLLVVVDMESNGFATDREKFISIQKKAGCEAEKIQSEIYTQIGKEINLNAPGQVKGALAAQGIRLADTREETLVACKHPIAETILRYRGVTKLAQQTTTLLERVKLDDRIHSSFNPTGTDTGRFSSSAPNLQNVGRGELRGCFIAAPGNVLVVADYSQIELRIAAAIAGEQKMIEAYRRREDLHRQTASLVLGKPLDAVTSEDRQLAKAVNFGLLYGQSPNGLVGYVKTNYGRELSAHEARTIHANFFRAYKGLKEWHDKARKTARQGSKEVRTISGRKRLLPTCPGSKKEWNRFTGLVNTPVQGGSADGLKLSLIAMAQKLPDGANIISTVHDEIIVEAPARIADEVKTIVHDCMVGEMGKLFPEVPVEVEVKVCANWGEK